MVYYVVTALTYHLLLQFISCLHIIYVYRKEEFTKICKEIGDVSSIYYPIVLKTMKPRGFAIVRYIRKQDAIAALEFMNNTCLDEENGRCMYARWHMQREYLSQNENPKIVEGLAYNVSSLIVP